MDAEQARNERENVMGRLDAMTRSIGASAQRMENSAQGLLRLAASLDGLTEAIDGLDERLERIEQFFAWLSAELPEARPGLLQQVLKKFPK